MTVSRSALTRSLVFIELKMVPYYHVTSILVKNIVQTWHPTVSNTGMNDVLPDDQKPLTPAFPFLPSLLVGELHKTPGSNSFAPSTPSKLCRISHHYIFVTLGIPTGLILNRNSCPNGCARFFSLLNSTCFFLSAQVLFEQPTVFKTTHRAMLNSVMKKTIVYSCFVVFVRNQLQCMPGSSVAKIVVNK